MVHLMKYKSINPIHLLAKRIALVVATIILLISNPYEISATSSGSATSKSKIYHCNSNSGNKIALTFDDGPHPIYTPMILDILNQNDIKATFFMVGENVELYGDVAARVLLEGHEIGNHTHTHPHIVNTPQSKLLKEILACDNSIYSISEYKTKLFRPPEGVVERNISELAEKLDYSIILWSIDTRDWAGTPTDDIVENVLKNTEGGDIILMHDYVSHNTPTPDALKQIIPVLKSKGYEFVTVSELIYDNR